LSVGQFATQGNNKDFATPWHDNPTNFWLGGKEDFARQQADALRAQGGNFFGQATNAQGRQGPQMAQVGDLADERIREGRNAVNDTTSQLRAMAMRGPGPSAAQAQLGTAQDANAAVAINAAAQSGGGVAANYQAGQQATAAGAGTNAQFAGARMGEANQERQQNAGALMQAAGLQQGLRQLTLGQRGQDFDFEQQNAILRQQNAAQNDRMSLGLGGLAQRSQQLGGAIDSTQLQALMQQEALRTRNVNAVRMANSEMKQKRDAADDAIWGSALGGVGMVVGGLAGGPAGAAVGGMVGSQVGSKINGYSAKPQYMANPYAQTGYNGRLQ
jgi:hypothetical protein